MIGPKGDDNNDEFLPISLRNEEFNLRTVQVAWYPGIGITDEDAIG